NIRKMATSRGENKNKNKEIAIKFDFHQILSLSLLSGVLMSRTLFKWNQYFKDRVSSDIIG
ncbi:hypothetical protein, partial [Macrococcoides caseolyticum]|uniref:hypothetical protein n=1 Tax=Macrococcoides caseolyticum TaxID=69966 RepID=UPI001E591545